MKKTLSIIRALALLPLSVAIGYLFAVPLFEWYLMHGVLSLVPLLLLVLAPVLLLVSASIATQHARIFRRLAALSPCWLTPLAILNAWTLAPGFPYGYGGYRFFLHWLTKYPNFGPINFEVFLGIVCVVLSSLLPPVFASYAITQRPRLLAILALVALELACLIAVMINLDFALLLAGFTIWSPIHFTGPLLRMAGAVAMCAATVRICLGKTEQSQGEQQMNPLFAGSFEGHA